MTKLEMTRLGMEFSKEYLREGKYYHRITETYKYRGEIKTRSYMDLTEEGKRVMRVLDTPMYVCPNCNRLVSFIDLEYWHGDDSEADLMNDEVICMCCYEDEMGEDL